MKLFSWVPKVGMEPRALPHFFWLDVLRALAALSVLLTHYYLLGSLHALPKGLVFPSYLTPRLPFYGLLGLFYNSGTAAVNLFWIISGFVFTSVYMKPGIASAKTFLVNRFARLYPLHFLTLIVVAVLQLVSLSMTGYFQIYTNNSLFTLILNLFFASGWGIVPEFAYSFNGPIWSVSIEVVIYAVFFLSLRCLVRWGAFTALFFAGIFALLSLSPIPGIFWPCGLCFFVGCLIFFFWQRFSDVPFLLLLVGGLGAILGAWARRTGGLLYGHGVWNDLLPFSALVLIATALDLVDTRKIGAPFKIIGDLTYGIYLWHIPVTIAGILVMSSLKISRNIIFTKIFFFLYLSLILAVSYVSFKFFELPLRNYIRKTWNS